MMGEVHVMDHPLIEHKISYIRRKDVGTKEFREVVGEIAQLMCYEATRDLEMREVEIETPVAHTVGRELDGKKLLDGGVCDSIPIRKFQSMGYARNIVVLTQYGGYRKQKSASLPLIRARYHAYPRFVEKMEDRHLRYNDTLDLLNEEEKKGNVLIIRPKKPVKISRLEKNVEKLQALYDEGYADTAGMIQDIRAFLAG